MVSGNIAQRLREVVAVSTERLDTGCPGYPGCASLGCTSVDWLPTLFFTESCPVIYAVLKTLHLLALIVWIGGMVFAHFFLRPALAQLEPPARLRLMHEVLGRFFQAVLVASLLTLGTGVWMLGRVAKQVVQAGGSFQMPWSWTVMATLGVLMVLIFGHIRFSLFKRLARAVAASDWSAGGAALGQIRQWVLVNLVLGLVVLLVTLLRASG